MAVPSTRARAGPQLARCLNRAGRTALKHLSGLGWGGQGLMRKAGRQAGILPRLGDSSPPSLGQEPVPTFLFLLVRSNSRPFLLLASSGDWSSSARHSFLTLVRLLYYSTTLDAGPTSNVQELSSVIRRFHFSPRAPLDRGTLQAPATDSPSRPPPARPCPAVFAGGCKGGKEMG